MRAMPRAVRYHPLIAAAAVAADLPGRHPGEHVLDPARTLRWEALDSSFPAGSSAWPGWRRCGITSPVPW